MYIRNKEVKKIDPMELKLDEDARSKLYNLIKSEELSEQQAHALFHIVERKHNTLIEGPAGTGKSFLISMLSELKTPTIFVAPTGIAAENIPNGWTIHSMFGLGRAAGESEEERTKVIRKALRNTDVLARLHGVKRIVIDEFSMVSREVFELVDKIMRRICEKPLEPFGGVQVVMFGDPYQLPPVGAVPCYTSPHWSQTFDAVVGFTTIFRQRDPVFRAALNELRKAGSISDLSQATLDLFKARHIEKLRDKIKSEPELREKRDSAIQLHAYREAAHKKNQQGLIDLYHKRVDKGEIEQRDGGPQDEDLGMVYVAEDKGSAEHLVALRSRCQAKDKIILAEGAPVILITNRYRREHGVSNGSRGEIVSFREGFPLVEFTNGKKLLIRPVEFELRVKSQVVASRKQVPLDLAWAITIHRSQGLTLDSVTLVSSNMFEAGQFYTGVSRASTKEGLFMHSEINKQHIHPHKFAQKFGDIKYGQRCVCAWSHVDQCPMVTGVVLPQKTICGQLAVENPSLFDEDIGNHLQRSKGGKVKQTSPTTTTVAEEKAEVKTSPKVDKESEKKKAKDGEEAEDGEDEDLVSGLKSAAGTLQKQLLQKEKLVSPKSDGERLTIVAFSGTDGLPPTTLPVFRDRKRKEMHERSEDDSSSAENKAKKPKTESVYVRPLSDSEFRTLGDLLECERKTQFGHPQDAATEKYRRKALGVCLQNIAKKHPELNMKPVLQTFDSWVGEVGYGKLLDALEKALGPRCVLAKLVPETELLSNLPKIKNKLTRDWLYMANAIVDYAMYVRDEHSVESFSIKEIEHVCRFLAPSDAEEVLPWSRIVATKVELENLLEAIDHQVVSVYEKCADGTVRYAVKNAF